MWLADWVQDRFGSRRGIDRIRIDKLRAEQIQLEEKDRVLSKEIETLERERAANISKGRSLGSSRQQVSLARKVKQIDDVVRSKDGQLSKLGRRLRLVGGLLEIKRNEQLVKDLRGASVLNTMSDDELIMVVEESTENDRFEMERFTNVLNELERARSVGETAATDEDIKAILAEMGHGPVNQADGVSQPIAPRAGGLDSDHVLISAEFEDI